MNYRVSAKDPREITLNESDPVASVLQNIAIILKTRKHSVPLYRDFGLSGQFIDKPIHIAKPMLIAELTEAIAEYEPRATVVRVTLEESQNIPGKLVVTVEVEIGDE
ncbi:MAG: GPW/gp25 family protein [Oscillospiraceae bacterium]|jgi:phage baseplate assembly protein W|nr:GPW/gp25 family protein [Oscillospiraceae bacterium]